MAGEAHPVSGQPIDVGRAHDGMTGDRQSVPAELVEGDQQHVRARHPDSLPRSAGTPIVMPRLARHTPAVR